MKTNLNVGIVVTFLAHFATSRPQSQGVTLVGGFIPIVSNTVRFPGEILIKYCLKTKVAIDDFLKSIDFLAHSSHIWLVVQYVCK